MNDAIVLKNIYHAPSVYLENKNISEAGRKEFLDFPIEFQYYLMGKMSHLDFEFKLAEAYGFISQILRYGGRSEIKESTEYYLANDSKARKWLRIYTGLAY